MIERSRILNTGSERIEVPEVTEGAEQRASRVGLDLAAVIGTLLLNVSLTDPRGDEKSGNTATETVKLVSVLLAVGGLLGVGQVVGASGQGRGNVVVEATALVEGQDEESFLPLRAGTERLIDLLDEGLAVGYETAVMHGGGTNTAAGRVQVRELGQSAVGGISVELVYRDNFVLVVCSFGPDKVFGLRASTTSGIPIVDPGVVGLPELLKNRVLGVGVGIESGIVGTVATGSTSNNSKTVWIGRLS
jgi:hypothetical protein